MVQAIGNHNKEWVKRNFDHQGELVRRQGNTTARLDEGAASGQPAAVVVTQTVPAAPAMTSTVVQQQTQTVVQPKITTLYSTVSAGAVPQSVATYTQSQAANGQNGPLTIIVQVTYPAVPTSSAMASMVNATALSLASAANASSFASQLSASNAAAQSSLASVHASEASVALLSSLSAHAQPTNNSTNLGQSNAKNGDGLSGGAIAGIVVGSVVGLLALIAIGAALIWKAKRRNEEDDLDDMMAPSSQQDPYGGLDPQHDLPNGSQNYDDDFEPEMREHQ